MPLCFQSGGDLTIKHIDACSRRFIEVQQQAIPRLRGFVTANLYWKAE